MEPPSWLKGWGPNLPVPASRLEIEAAIARAKRALTPASPEQAAVLLEETLELYGAPKNWDQIAQFYLEAVSDMPLDLIRETLKQVRLNCKFFPKPAEIREPIREEMARRKAALSRLKTALWCSQLRMG